MKFAADHMDKEKTFWRKTLWSHETKTELFGHHKQQYVRRREGEAFNPENTRPTVQHGAARILLWGCFAAGGSAALKKVNGIMKKEDYRQIIQENLKSSADDWVQLGFPSGQWSQTHIRSGKGMDQSG